MATPLYKALNPSGMTTYALPGVTADINQSYQNDRYVKRFSHFALLNLPSQNTNPSVGRERFDFDGVFQSFTPLIGTDFATQLVNALRNYTANRDEVIRLSKVSPNEYFYDPNHLRTVSERNFWKLLKETGVIQFDIARGPSSITPGGENLDWSVDATDREEPSTRDKYFALQNQTLTTTDTQNSYYPEVLWKERESIPYKTIGNFTTGTILGNDVLYIILDVNDTNNTVLRTFVMNLKVNDWVNFKGEEIGILTSEMEYLSTNKKIVEIKTLTSGPFAGKFRIAIDIQSYGGGFNISNMNYTPGTTNVSLNYEKVVPYIGEISAAGSSIVGNISETTVIAVIPEEHGSTPKVLFRTISDINYRPGARYPLLPSEYNTYVIVGAESPDHPFNTNPNEQVGHKYGFYDFASTSRYQYLNNNGDTARRTGDFYGVNYLFGNPAVFDSSRIDGLSIDWNKLHYSDMNDISTPFGILDTFNKYNSTPINNEAPKSFDFNAIAWFYELTDTLTGEKTINLYGISFLDNPANDCGSADNQIPKVRKIAPGNGSNPTAYQFTLRQGFNISGDVVPVYDVEGGYDMRDYNIFSEAISALVSTNDSFQKVLQSNTTLVAEIERLKSLVYNQSDISDIRNNIERLNELLNLYSTLQIGNSETIISRIDNTVSPAVVRLDAIGNHIQKSLDYNVTSLYDAILSRIVPRIVPVTSNKDFILYLNNDDSVSLSLETNLKLVLDRDLAINQTMTLIMRASIGSLEDKSLDIEIRDRTGSIVNSQWIPTSASLLSDLPIPVRNNVFNTSIQSSAYRAGFIELDSAIQSIEVVTVPEIEIRLRLDKTYPINLFRQGDWVYVQFSFVFDGNQYNLSSHKPIKTVTNDLGVTVLAFDYEGDAIFEDAANAYTNIIPALPVLGVSPINWYPYLSTHVKMTTLRDWVITITRRNDGSYITSVKSNNNLSI